MSYPTLLDIQADLLRVGEEARNAYDAAWTERVAGWKKGIFAGPEIGEAQPLMPLSNMQRGCREMARIGRQVAPVPGPR